MHDPARCKWHHIEADIILCAMRWYLRYPLSYCDAEELPRKHGVWVDHATVLCWVQRYAPEPDKRCRPQPKSTNDSLDAGGAERFFRQGVQVSHGPTPRVTP
jgi:transposase, IS6 family